MANRVLSGMRPTGNLHLGHLVGALQNWIKLQNQYETYYMVADWHAISTAYEDNLNLNELSIEIVAEWISSGLDPDKSVIFVQSHVKEHSELFLLFSMITPLALVERNPSYKEMINELKEKNISTYGFLGYPVLQAADILVYLADKVPVGVDQLPHIELTREIARKFNNLYGEVFPEPQALLTEFPKLLGTDNRKMSKSYNNSIYLSDEDKIINKKVMSMITDPERIHPTDKGHPEVCTVFSYHQQFTKEKVNEIEEKCRAGTMGCVACKKILGESLVKVITPIREKRNELLQNKDRIRDILETGQKKALHLAQETMDKVRSKMQI